MTDSEKLIDAIIVAPFALALGMVTKFLAVWFGSELYLLIEPDRRIFDEVIWLLWITAIFLILLSIPRAILYTRGSTRKRWTFLVYYGLPFAMFLFLPISWLEWGWLAVATLAWIEVLLLYLPTVFPRKK